MVVKTRLQQTKLVRSLRTLSIFEHAYIIVARRLLHRNIRTIALWGTKLTRYQINHIPNQPDTKSTQINHIQNQSKSTRYKINHIPNQLPDQRSFLRYQNQPEVPGLVCLADLHPWWLLTEQGDSWHRPAVFWMLLLRHEGTTNNKQSRSNQQKPIINNSQ